MGGEGSVRAGPASLRSTCNLRSSILTSRDMAVRLTFRGCDLPQQPTSDIAMPHERWGANYLDGTTHLDLSPL